MDDQANSEFQFKKLSKRRRGAKAIGLGEHWDAADFFNQLIAENAPRKRALGVVQKRFKISKSTLEDAIHSLMQATAENDRLNYAEMTFPKSK